MAEPDYAAMAKELSMLFDEGKYEAFLRRQSQDGDHSFLLAAIKRSNLRPSVRKVLEELIPTGKRGVIVARRRSSAFTRCHGPRSLSCRALGSVSHAVTAPGLSVASDSAARGALASS